MNKIYELKLHETVELNRDDFKFHSGVLITRVPGGWNYQYIDSGTGEVRSVVFVPFNNEFQR